MKNVKIYDTFRVILIVSFIVYKKIIRNKEIIQRYHKSTFVYF